MTMNHHRCASILALLVAAVLAIAGDAAPQVMLKLDDLGRHKGRDPGISECWQRCADFLAQEKVKANFGILTECLEDECPKFVATVKGWVDAGLVEIWYHGHYGRGIPDDQKVEGRTAEYMGGSVAAQKVAFRRGLDLFKTRFGFDLHAFGPHATHVDGITYQALAEVPEIQAVWGYGPPKGQDPGRITVIPRQMELEKPLFVPNAENIKASYEKKGRALASFSLQGHPGQWDDARFAAFKECVLFLKGQGCRFVTVSEHLKTLPAK